MRGGGREREGGEVGRGREKKGKEENTILPKFPKKSLDLLRGSIHHN